jgi:hypothetical protein
LNGVVLISAASVVHCDIAIEGNRFDLDPYHEGDRSVDGSGKLTGAWSATDGTTYFGVNISNIAGVSVRRNKFSQCRRARKTNTTQGTFEDNEYLYEWGSALRGIAQVELIDGGIHTWIDCDPRSANYGKYTTPADSSFVNSATAAPTAGYFAAGHTVRNTTRAADGVAEWVANKSGVACGTAWVTLTAYALGDRRYSGTRVYEVTTAGTTGAGAPSGTGSGISDGTVTWKYVGELITWLSRKYAA